MEEEYLRSVSTAEPQPLDGPVELVEYSADWPVLFLREAQRLRAVLGDRAFRIEHVGSTSVPGLAAKPIVDVVLICKRLSRGARVRASAGSGRLHPSHP